MTNEYNNNKQILYIDSPLYKQLTPNGALSEVINSQALMNAFQIWLVSAPREQVRTRTGGYVISQLFKPLNDSNARLLRSSILSGIKNDFTPSLTVDTLNVIPDTTNRQWIIQIIAYNTELNIGVNDLAFISNTP